MSTLVRVTVTLPPAVVEAADALATRERRSRSQIVAEALRQLTAAPAARPGVVREAAAPPAYVQRAFDEARGAQLAADLALTPEQRVRESEELVSMALRVHGVPSVAHVFAFDSYDDYLEWKKRDVLW